MKLFNKFKKQHNSSFIIHNSISKGFTLIELLIVIAILGVLAAAVLVAINPGQKIAQTKNARVKSDLASIGRRAALFNTELATTDSCTVGGTWPQYIGMPLCGIKFMDGTRPTDPSGREYVYAAIAAGGGACNTTGTIPCTAISITGTAYADVRSNVNAGIWCWRSASGSIENLWGSPIPSCNP